jgi:hypothetical protein
MKQLKRRKLRRKASNFEVKENAALTERRINFRNCR